MHALLDHETLIWGLLGAAVLIPVLAALHALRDKHRVLARLGNLEDVLRRMRSADPGSQFDDGSEENSYTLKKSQLVLETLLDRFPEITKDFVLVERIESLGDSLLDAFRRVLDASYGAVFVREGSELRLLSKDGLGDDECPDGLRVGLGEGRIGYTAEKCLILTPGDFAALEGKERQAVEQGRALPRDFDLYVPMVHRDRALGCLAVGGVKKVQKTNTVSMSLANLGALVLTNIQRADEIRVLSEEDPLTRLSNRRHAYAQLAARLDRRDSSPFALCLFDIDHFKRINDAFGHAVGDEVLVQVAEQTRSFVDRAQDEFACRFGGEEFLCVLSCPDVPALAARLEAFRHAVSQIRVETEGEGGPVGVRISGGVAFCPAEEEDADSLIRLADDRLYAAKDAGRNRVFFETAPGAVSS